LADVSFIGAESNFELADNLNKLAMSREKVFAALAANRPRGLKAAPFGLAWQA